MCHLVYQNANHNNVLPLFVVSIFLSIGVLFSNVSGMPTVYYLPLQFLFALNSKKEDTHNAFM